MDLNTLRSEIDSIDGTIVSLLNKRLKIALQIGALKTEQNLPVYNEAREQEVLKSIEQRNTGPLEDNQIRQIFQTIMAVCRNAQNQPGKD